MQDVVLVGGDDQPFDRQAHALRDMTREDVAEIAGRHGEADLALRGAERHGGREVIDHLRQNPRPVDRVDARQPDRIAEVEIVEHVLQPRLAIVEIAFQGEGMDIHLGRGRHLAALHLRDAPFGEQDEDIDIVEAPERLDRGRPGIARGRADDGDAAARPRQRDLEQLPDELHREVLEGERRAVEQFQQEMVGCQLHQGRAGGVAKALIGLADGAAKLGIGEGVADKGAHDAKGGFLVGLPAKRRDLLRRQGRDRFRHIKAAVAGKPGQHGFVEGQDGGLPPCGNVTHSIAPKSAVA